MINQKSCFRVTVATTGGLLAALVPALPNAFAQVLLPPTGSSAHNEVEVNLGVLGGENPDQAGRYNGLNASGVFLNGGFSLNHVPKRKSNSTWFYHINGWNLTLQPSTQFGTHAINGEDYRSSVANPFANSGEIYAGFGQQGTWEGQIDFNSMTYTGNVIDSFWDVNGNVATLHPGLTPYGGATATMPGPITASHYNVFTLPKYMAPYQVGTRRDILGSKFSYHWDGWTLTGAWRHSHEYGSLSKGIFGPWDATPFIEPVDYDTNRFDFTAFRGTRLNQLLIRYTLSHFSDGNRYIALPYPTSNGFPPYRLGAAYSTPPSNTAQYLTMQFTSSAIPKVRVSLNAQLGLETQNDSFAPDTADPMQPASPNLNAAGEGTTATSPDITARVFHGHFELYTHPFDNLDASVYYGMDGRNVTLNQFAVYPSSLGGALEFGISSNPVYVVPQDWLKQDAGVRVGYRILPEYGTKLTLGYRADFINRNNAQVNNSSTNTATAALTSPLGSNINGRLSYTYRNRSGSLDYVRPWQNLETGTAGQPELCTAANCSGAYYQAPMISNAVEVMLDYTVNPKLSTGFLAQFKNDNYTYPPDNGATLTGVGEGIKRDYRLSIGPDINYRLSQNTKLHFFYTFERIFYDNRGNGACATSNTGGCAGSAGYFQNLYTSNLNTIGVDGTWQVSDKLKLRAHETLSYGSVMYGQYNGVFVSTPTESYQNVYNYPDINSLMNDLRLTATYTIRKGLDVIGQAAWEYFRENNWNDYAAPAQGAGSKSISFLSPGYGPPNYNVVFAMIGVRERF